MSGHGRCTATEAGMRDLAKVAETVGWLTLLIVASVAVVVLAMAG